MHAHVHKEFFRNRDVSPSPRLFFSFCLFPLSLLLPHWGWPVSRGRSYIIHPRGWLLGVVAKNLAEQKLSSVLGRSELSSLSLSFSPCSSSSPSPLHLFASLLFYVSRLFHRFHGGQEEERNVSPTRVH